MSSCVTDFDLAFFFLGDKTSRMSQPLLNSSHVIQYLKLWQPIDFFKIYFRKSLNFFKKVVHMYGLAKMLLARRLFLCCDTMWSTRTRFCVTFSTETKIFVIPNYSKMCILCIKHIKYFQNKLHTACTSTTFHNRSMPQLTWCRWLTDCKLCWQHCELLIFSEIIFSRPHLSHMFFFFFLHPFQEKKSFLKHYWVSVMHIF